VKTLQQQQENETALRRSLKVKTNNGEEGEVVSGEKESERGTCDINTSGSDEEGTNGKGKENDFK